MSIKTAVQRDARIIGVATALTVIFMIVLSYKNGMGTGVAVGLFFTISYILPGYYLVGLLSPSTEIVERIILGIVSWMGGAGIVMYYLNWFGVSSKTLTFVLPVVGVVIAVMYYARAGNKKVTDSTVQTE